MCLLSALTPAEAAEQVRGYLAEAEQLAAELRTIAVAADATEHPRGKLRMGRLAMELGIRLAEAQQEWARWALAELSE
jgi:Virulence activator alpha C-term